MNYEEMSDFEINVAVANRVLWDNRHCEDIDCNDKNGTVSWADGANWHEFDPCNKPSDAWPIIDKHKICIHNDEMDGSSYACSFDKFGYVSKESYCDNTLRAAMIVFLMMQEQAK